MKHTSNKTTEKLSIVAGNFTLQKGTCGSNVLVTILTIFRST